MLTWTGDQVLASGGIGAILSEKPSQEGGHLHGDHDDDDDCCAHLNNDMIFASWRTNDKRKWEQLCLHRLRILFKSSLQLLSALNSSSSKRVEALEPSRAAEQAAAIRARAAASVQRGKQQQQEEEDPGRGKAQNLLQSKGPQADPLALLIR